MSATLASEERAAIARHGRAQSAVQSCSSDASREAMRLAYLQIQLAELDLALVRIPRGPKTARRVGVLRQQRARVAEILRGLAEHLIEESCSRQAR